MSAHPLWYIARAVGIVAWILLCTSMLAGVTLTYRRAGSAPAMLDLHRYLSLLAVVFTIAHAVALVADGFVGYRFVQVLLPLASLWRPGPVGWGVLAMYLLLLVEGSSLLGRRLSRTKWRRLHNLSYPCFAAATIHFLSAGSEVVRWIPRWLAIAFGGVVVAMALWGAARAESRTRLAENVEQVGK